MKPRPRLKYALRRVTAVAGVTVLLATGIYLPLTLLAPIAPVAAEVQHSGSETQPAAQLSWPGVAASAIGAVGFPGTLAASGSTQPRSIASITKVITSLVVLSVRPLALGDSGPAIQFTEQDAALVKAYRDRDGTTKPVRAGMVLSQLQVNEVMLIASANNYAESYSTWAFGSQEKFLDAAAAWLTAHGMNDTTLLDSSGMNPGNRSTAADLVTLGKLALADPVVAMIVATKSVSVPGVGDIKNSNRLLGHGGVDGIKTGTLDAAGACLLFSTEFTVGSHRVTMVGVALGGADHPSLDTAVRSLIATAKRGFHDVSLSKKGQSFASYSTAWKTKVRAIASASRSVLVWANTPITATVTSEPISLTRAGATVGSVDFSVRGKKISVPLKLDKGLDDPGALWRLGNPVALLG
ncbi:D-alanyl-D-alanine carboxypeptidase family protein [Parafrigoribacterium soli]|uniref:D-alanyl-D-alanine carboxypeptidase family protein n=1 Tax=Parafrigoribacterium soli TaxID=3144663 RepID=UPI0032EEA0E7